jgi:CheY-like chemotaxis protein
MIGQQIVSNSAERKTILCIDDDQGMLNYEKALLERRGYAVLTAASARQGLNIAAGATVAAVIVDYNMPEMNGHEVAMEIRRLRPGVPIVMVSTDEDIPQLVLDVVDAFVSKDKATVSLVPAMERICGNLQANP